MAQVSVAKAKIQFDELITRVAAGERIIIRQHDRAVAALIGTAELERLEQWKRVARQAAAALGQDAKLLRQIEEGKLHPAMAAFGLWRAENDLDHLTEEIYANRNQQPPRVGISW